MSIPLEHDYIGLTELSSEKTEEEDDNSSSNNNNNNVLNLKRTELRLGLPGSESPERREEMGLTLSLKGVEDSSNGLCLNSFVSGAKRGFSDAIDASGKWGFSGNGGSQVDWAQGGGVVFSPRAGNGGSRTLLQGAGLAANGTKDVRPPTTPNSLQPKKPDVAASSDQSPPSKAQVVGWPPIRSFRKNTMTPVSSAAKESEEKDAKSGPGCLYVKVSMDGAPYLRKVDLKTYSNYRELSAALEKMFSCFTIGQCGSHGVQGRNGQSESRLMDVLRGSECVLTFEDKDGDWMLVGDVPWDMFIDSCKRLRIMKGSEAIGLAPKVMEKSKNWS